MTRIISRPNCGIERAIVPRKMPSEVAENRCRAAPNRNSGTEPAIGTPSAPLTTSQSERPAVTSTTAPLAQTLAAMISNGVRGMTSRCSRVPCSRSRISAAPARMTASMVMLSMIFMTPPNQTPFRFGLNLTRTTRGIGRAVPLLRRWTKPLISSITMFWM